MNVQLQPTIAHSASLRLYVRTQNAMIIIDIGEVHQGAKLVGLKSQIEEFVAAMHHLSSISCSPHLLRAHQQKQLYICMCSHSWRQDTIMQSLVSLEWCFQSKPLCTSGILSQSSRAQPWILHRKIALKGTFPTSPLLQITRVDLTSLYSFRFPAEGERELVGQVAMGDDMHEWQTRHSRFLGKTNCKLANLMHAHKQVMRPTEIFRDLIATINLQGLVIS